MARTAKEKRLATIPSTYIPNFVERLDGRSLLATVIPERIAAIESDLGGPEGLSYARRSLVRRVVWLEAVVETFEQNLASDRITDLGAYTQSINSLLGLYRLLGLERKARATYTRRELMSRGSVTPIKPAEANP
jgi:hypothetical protein